MSIQYTTGFAAGADTTLEAFDPDWSHVVGAALSKFGLLAVDGFLRNNLDTPSDVIYKKASGGGAITGDQKIIADLTTGNGAGGKDDVVGLCCRVTATPNAYLMRLVVSGSSFFRTIERYDAGAFTSLAQDSPALGASTLYAACYASAILTGGNVGLTFHVPGFTDLTFTDTSGSKLLTGNPGLVMFSNVTVAANAGKVDNLSIDDLAPPSFPPELMAAAVPVYAFP